MIRKPSASHSSAATNPRMKLSNRNKGTLFQRSVSRPDEDNRNTSGMTSRKWSDASMRRTEVYSPSLRRVCRSLGTSVSHIYRPWVSDILDNDGQYFQHPIEAPVPSFISSSDSRYPTAESLESIYLSRRGHCRNSEMTGRNDKADAQQDSSGSLIGKCVYTDGRTDDINASDIIAIGHRLALRVKFAVRRAVSDSETTCSLNCMRLHVARSLPKRCQRWEHACYRKSLFLTPLQEVGYIKIGVYETTFIFVVIYSIVFFYGTMVLIIVLYAIYVTFFEIGNITLWVLNYYITDIKRDDALGIFR